jgi:hypothetical protein
MAWGWLHQPGQPQLLVYAAPHVRLRQLGHADLDAAFHAFPGFIAGLGLAPAGGGALLLSAAGAVTALVFDPGNAVPRAAHSRALPDSADDQAIRATARALLTEPALAVKAGAVATVTVVRRSAISGDDHCRFDLCRLPLAGGPAEPETRHALPIEGAAIWAADLRDPAWILRASQIRRRSALVWRSLLAAAGVAVVLLLAQLGLGGLAAWNRVQAATIARLQGPVNRVQNTITLAERLTRSVEQDLQPFRLLDSVNTPRPKTVYFNRISARRYHELVIEGESTLGVAPVNQYAEAIGRLPFVTEVDNISQTKTGKTSFEFTVTFSELPPAPAPREPEPGQPVEPAATGTEGETEQ